MKISFQSVALTLSFVISSLALSGCQTTRTVDPNNLTLLNQAPFEILKVESQEEIFVLDKQIISSLQKLFRQNDQPEIKQAQLVMQFLLENGDESLLYMSDANLTASQTYQNLNANCLSLSILAYSLSDFLNLQAEFQKVHVPEYWATSRGYNFLSGHINLKIHEDRTRYYTKQVLHTTPRTLTIDFDPNSRQQAFRTTPITKDRVTAMFYNNKGAINMVEGNHDLAFSYFKSAIELDPNYTSAWANLAILYRIAGEFDTAEVFYNQAISLDPNNNTAKGNLAVLYDLTNRTKQAEEIRSALHNYRKNNPYYILTLGNQAMEEGKINKAIRHYRSALKINSQLHEGYFALAKAYFAKGDLVQTKHHIKRALNHAEFEHNQKQYRGKLEWLDAVAKN
ncbi:tetratricopeptide repeat protein [Pseudoalteromonas luteoviolacea]|uniref:tetratricopeptide repeat protein n=1 Tax=Pseudoalteromonas luteoviolacea TaxID=43657 RepID=UPI001F35974E|nr:tetratricopeptide repeat protein [Pseudoalteromonas luteoviolacea]MCF6437930.1 tetratricopeptide repeat protein [Pseudoalteromonas luteoviolacea]